MRNEQKISGLENEIADLKKKHENLNTGDKLRLNGKEYIFFAWLFDCIKCKKTVALIHDIEYDYNTYKDLSIKNGEFLENNKQNIGVYSSFLDDEERVCLVCEGDK